MGLRIKAGVGVLGVQPEILLAIIVAEGVYRSIGADCVVTEITGGKHGRHSHHRKGLAIDLRTRNVVQAKWTDLRDRLRAALGESYQVVLEPDHIHVEYDPA